MKKTMSILLTLVMVFSIMAVAAFAQEESTDVVDDTEDAAQDAADDAADMAEDAADDAADAEDLAEDEAELAEEAEEDALEAAEEDAEAEEEAAEEETEAAEEDAEAADEADEEALEAEEDAEVEEDVEEEPLLEVSEEEEEEAGVTPDSPLYGLERAMERISMALTLGKSAKAKKGLAHALERKQEIKLMLAEKKFDEAAEAQEAMDEDLADVEEAIDDIENSDAEEELTEVEDIEGDVADLQEEVDDLANEVAVKMTGRELNEEEQARVDEIVNGLKESTGKASVTVKAKKNNTRVKVKLMEDAENGKGKKVTVQHETLTKTNQGAEKKKAAAEEAGEEYVGKEKGKPAKEESYKGGKPDKEDSDKGSKGGKKK